jgi:hypothetical protein
VKINLAQQIREVERELRQRRSSYPRLVDRGTMRQAEAGYAMRAMEAALRTLRWLETNEIVIRRVFDGRIGAEEASCSSNM